LVQDLEENLEVLHQRVYSGAYRASPSRRAYISKADGRLRPLGIATLEDKILQRAVVEVLNAVYEEDFLGFSYGFRPGRSPHDALDALTVAIERKKVNWVLDADVKEFFTSLDHDWLTKFIEHRIADKRVLRLIHKWVNAGVIEDGKWTASETGAPQGASASPLLANIYLHYVLDRRVRQWRRQQAHGDVIITRFADLCRYRHKSAHAEFRIMPRIAVSSHVLPRQVHECSGELGIIRSPDQGFPLEPTREETDHEKAQAHQRAGSACPLRRQLREGPRRAGIPIGAGSSALVDGRGESLAG
jgi:group II intron reverse transcriptase/maturase